MNKTIERIPSEVSDVLDKNPDEQWFHDGCVVYTYPGTGDRTIVSTGEVNLDDVTSHVIVSGDIGLAAQLLDAALKAVRARLKYPNPNE